MLTLKPWSLRTSDIVRAAVTAIWFVSCAPVAVAKEFPDRPVRLIVGQSTGTATDIVARVVAEKWSELLRQPIVVDNRPGAGETLAAQAVAQATPDGHTILFGSIASHGIAPAIYTRLPYDPARDFTPLSLVGKVPNVLVVHPGLPLGGVTELANYAKAYPARLSYASTGVGTSTHLGMELLKARLGIDIVHVAYKAGNVAFADLVGGQVAAGLFNLPSQLGFIRAGKVRAIGVSSLKRSPQLLDVPTIDESGVRGYEVVVWYAVFAPALIRKPVQTRLHADLVTAINSQELRQRLSAQLGVELVYSTPDELGKFSRAEIEKWRKVASDAGIKLN